MSDEKNKAPEVSQSEKNFTTPVSVPNYFMNENVLPEDRFAKQRSDSQEEDNP